jgi:hypothetical protein
MTSQLRAETDQQLMRFLQDRGPGFFAAAVLRENVVEIGPIPLPRVAGKNLAYMFFRCDQSSQIWESSPGGMRICQERFQYRRPGPMVRLTGLDGSL